MVNQKALEWVQGRASLGAAGGWTAEEMRLVADLAYALAEQGRHDEAITAFEGLAALAPATSYFQSALGALWLRKGDPARAVAYLDAALAADPTDITALANRGEALMQAGDTAGAQRDFEEVARLAPAPAPNTVAEMCATRARALHQVLRGSLTPDAGT
ncbi:MAG TPA: tetratricopeptide repeat protein [Pyrinomonadaceae bacterium]|nr:tetratricopeptide repeat protein [Pyrinomonadaceae bacterium]